MWIRFVFSHVNSRVHKVSLTYSLDYEPFDAQRLPFAVALVFLIQPSFFSISIELPSRRRHRLILSSLPPETQTDLWLPPVLDGSVTFETGDIGDG